MKNKGMKSTGDPRAFSEGMTDEDEVPEGGKGISRTGIRRGLAEEAIRMRTQTVR